MTISLPLPLPLPLALPLTLTLALTLNLALTLILTLTLTLTLILTLTLNPARFKEIAKDEEKFATFTKNFGRYIKVGLIEDKDNKDALLSLVS